MQVYATAGSAELGAVYDVVQKLACVAQSYADGSSDERQLRAAQKQLRRLRAEAEEALAAAQEPGLQAP